MYGDGEQITTPIPTAGQEQDLDENYVVYLLWNLWDGDDLTQTGEEEGERISTDAILTALRSKRLTDWNRGAEGADFVDFVDAVLCADPSVTNSVSTMLVEQLGFPYDGEPDCQ